MEYFFVISLILLAISVLLNIYNYGQKKKEDLIYGSPIKTMHESVAEGTLITLHDGFKTKIHNITIMRNGDEDITLVWFYRDGDLVYDLPENIYFGY